MISMITAKEAANLTKENLEKKQTVTAQLVNDFLHVVNVDIAVAVADAGDNVCYKLDDLKTDGRFYGFPLLATYVETGNTSVKDVVSDFGKMVVDAFNKLDYRVELNAYSLTISWEHLIGN